MVMACPVRALNICRLRIWSPTCICNWATYLVLWDI